MASAARPVDRKVQGFCPMGCGETLVVAGGGHVTCMSLRCPRPDVVSELLSDQESEHIVVFSETDFTVRHPLRERLDDALIDCELHKHIASMAGPPVKPGTYRARYADCDAATPGVGCWTWEAVCDA